MWERSKVGQLRAARLGLGRYEERLQSHPREEDEDALVARDAVLQPRALAHHSRGEKDRGQIHDALDAVFAVRCYYGVAEVCRNKLKAIVAVLR